MPPVIPASPLPRLDVKPAGGWWGLRHRLGSPRGRYRALRSLIIDDTVDPARKAARMRTLVDLGVWDPGLSPTNLKSARQVLSRFLFHTLGAPSRPLCEKAFHIAMEAGADPGWHERTDYKDNFLTFFARRGMLAHFKVALAAGVDPYHRDNCNESTIVVLLRGMGITGEKRAISIKLADMLIAHGVDVNHVGHRADNSNPPLPLMAALNFSPDVGLPWLLDNGADINARDHEGNSLAHWVCLRAGVPSRVERLLAPHKMDVHCANDRGETPLWQAVSIVNKLAVNDLIDRGAALDVRPAHDHTFEGVPQGGIGRSLLQVLIQECDPDDWALSLAGKIERAHPDCWSWPTPQGLPLAEFVNRCIEEPQWRAMASRSTMHDTVASPSPAPPSLEPRLTRRF